VKKLLIFTVLMASMVFVVPASEAKTADNTNLSNALELQQRRGRLYEQRRRDQRRSNRRYNRRARTVYRSTLVRRGYRLYRYTYRITYLPNGRVIRRLVSRTRVR
jgi:hypothetical protein